MGVVTIPSTEVDGATAEASNAMNNWNTLYTVVNGNLDSANIASSGVATTNIQDSAVTTIKIDSSAVTRPKMAVGAVPKVHISTKTEAFTAEVSADYYFCNVGGTATAIAVTIPTAIGNSGAMLGFKKLDTATHAITLQATATIGLTSEAILHTRGETIVVCSDGAAWITMYRSIPSNPVKTTLTIEGVTANPVKGTTSVDELTWARDGEYMTLNGSYEQTASSADPGSGTYLIKIPGGWSIDTSLITPSTDTTGGGFLAPVGSCGLGNGGVSRPGVARVHDSASLILSAYQQSVDQHVTMADNHFGFTQSNAQFAFEARVPILGWES